MPDVCIVDIEGEEIDVVPSLPDAKTMIVETHGVFESPTDSIIEILRDRGYEVHDAGVAEPEMARQHAKDDVKVVIATKKERPNNIQ
ncbi:hypothetical protein HBNXHr_0465 [Halorhabdus sp. BNX81]|nr:hypothetical protein HBNXHr_0465 [Halorhabdus sp. BNX81]